MKKLSVQVATLVLTIPLSSVFGTSAHAQVAAPAVDFKSCPNVVKLYEKLEKFGSVHTDLRRLELVELKDLLEVNTVVEEPTEEGPRKEADPFKFFKDEEERRIFATDLRNGGLKIMMGGLAITASGAFMEPLELRFRQLAIKHYRVLKISREAGKFLGSSAKHLNYTKYATNLRSTRLYLMGAGALISSAGIALTVGGVVTLAPPLFMSGEKHPAKKIEEDPSLLVTLGKEGACYAESTYDVPSVGAIAASFIEDIEALTADMVAEVEERTALTNRDPALTGRVEKNLALSRTAAPAVSPVMETRSDEATSRNANH